MSTAPGRPQCLTNAPVRKQRGRWRPSWRPAPRTPPHNAAVIVHLSLGHPGRAALDQRDGDAVHLRPAWNSVLDVVNGAMSVTDIARRRGTSGRPCAPGSVTTPTEPLRAPFFVPRLAESRSAAGDVNLTAPGISASNAPCLLLSHPVPSGLGSRSSSLLADARAQPLSRETRAEAA